MLILFRELTADTASCEDEHLHLVTRSCFLCVYVTEGSDQRFSLEDFGFLVFHSPYCKLVQKSVARLMLNDFLNHPNPNTETGPFTGLDAFRYQKSIAHGFLERARLTVDASICTSFMDEGHQISSYCLLLLS